MSHPPALMVCASDCQSDERAARPRSVCSQNDTSILQQYLEAMPRLCSVCNHPRRMRIDERIASGISMRRVATEFDLKPDAIRRHRIAHLTPALVSLAGHRAGAISALDRLEHLYGKARDVLDAAEEGGRLTLSLAAIKELRSLVELLARITGELDERPVQQTVNILTSPEWLRVQSAMLDALKPHPAAKVAVAERLMALDAYESDSPALGAALEMVPVSQSARLFTEGADGRSQA